MLKCLFGSRGAAIFVVIANLLALAGCQHGATNPGKGKTLVIPENTVFAAGINVPNSVRMECDLERKISKYVAKEASAVYSQVKTANKVSAKSPGTVLTMQITSAPGWESNWRGKREVTVRGALYENGIERGDFIVNRITARSKGFVAYRGTCKMLDDIADKIAEDIGEWLRSPRPDARLGDPT
jgi:hypothetical protein